MKFNSKKIAVTIVAITVVTLVTNSCGIDQNHIDFSKYDKIYMPQAQDNPAVRPVLIVDSTQTIGYNAAYAGANTPDKNINISFNVNPALVDSFNNNNFTSYPILPEASYQLGKTKAMIPAGQRRTETLKLSLQTEGYIKAGGQEYLLPISINVNNADVPLNKDLKTTYFLIQGSYVNIDKSNWKVVDFDSQQPGRPDLAASNVIDGDDSSIWNTQYTSPRPGPPHYVSIDMGKSHKIHGFKIVGRDRYKNQNPKKVEFQFSDDGQNWRDGETFTLPMNLTDVITAKVYLSKTVDARYFKFIVIHDVETAHKPMNVCELYAF